MKTYFKHVFPPVGNLTCVLQVVDREGDGEVFPDAYGLIVIAEALHLDPWAIARTWTYGQLWLTFVSMKRLGEERARAMDEKSHAKERARDRAVMASIPITKIEVPMKESD